MKITGAETKLEKEVQRTINQEDNIQSFLEDLSSHGCISGMVGGLVYYSDTLKFYKKHKKEIQVMVREFCDDTGSDISCLNGWDKEDIFAEETNNQNILAWFGFEETARNLAQRNDIEI